MKRPDEILQRLLRTAAAYSEAPAQMPFGFDTRVLASVREAGANGSAVIAFFARRVMAIACAVIALAAAGLYSSSGSDTNADATNEYGIIDTAIQSNLSE
jgi:hypothetical protein